MSSLESQRILEQLRGAKTHLLAGTFSFEQYRSTLTSLLYGPGELGADVHVEPFSLSGNPAEWITVPGTEDSPVFYYLHGGGYIGPYNSAYRRMLASLAITTGIRVLALEYRLAPVNPFPAAIEDAVAGYRWLLNQGFDPSRIAIGGDSAGAGLTVATLLVLRDAGERLPKAQVLISPWVDLEGTGDSLTTTRKEREPFMTAEGNMGCALSYVPHGDLRNPLVSPIYADLHDLPIMQIHVGDAEILLDDAMRLAEAARAAEVEVQLKVWDELWHIFPIHVGHMPEAQQAIDEMGTFLSEHLSMTRPASD